jgi:hypothetical protein
MLINGRSRYLALGIMILLAFSSAACSADVPSAAESESAEATGRDIKVYESPT